MRLEGKVAIVTGAARGIGLAIAETYAREGASVLLADLDGDEAAKAAGRLAAAYPGSFAAAHTDVASKADCVAMFATAHEALGPVDILVCNAGIVRPAAAIEDISPETWDKVIGINLMGAIYPTQVFAPEAKERGTGRIIYMASVAGEVGGVSAEMTYSVTKAGVLCLTKATAKQLAPHGVTVNAIAPGTIQTAMTDILQYDASVLESIPLGRYGEVSDIAGAALYLVSDDAKYVTGTTLDVNGGLFMR
ncbi:SDR family oxidoreductase [Novosphingobium profundi]|uniref:SDR family NAD(P)-dependent oxidoreductase n=1 Tax=Novosphingobium profundi TaxID=1774954 RepID=UPI001BDA1107|nr:SDR family NAD(P)-dependent oxidoreductase [Novosphingobium profundi]MBT0670236.1 SDR family oxidoreductase [Novosphingobium profundi]